MHLFVGFDVINNSEDDIENWKRKSYSFKCEKNWVLTVFWCAIICECLKFIFDVSECPQFCIQRWQQVMCDFSIKIRIVSFYVVVVVFVGFENVDWKSQTHKNSPPLEIAKEKIEFLSSNFKCP